MKSRKSVTARPRALIRPPPLGAGDTIGIIAPASPAPDPKRLDIGVAKLESLGFKVKLSRHVRARLGFLAGPDRDRARDLMTMFTDREVQGILCLRGGYGTPRLLPLLDYALIRRHPKVFVGYSDITGLHCAFLRQAGMISFHGPHLIGDFAREPLPDFTRDSFLRAVQGNFAGDVAAGCPERAVQVWRRGCARGRLIGGNLSLLCSLVGTRWLPDLRGAILFLEDVGEAPYRIDRMLTQLLNAGTLSGVAGIAVGVNADCGDPRAAESKEYRQTADEVFRERLLPLKVPLVSGLPFGHVPVNATLPVGATATLDAHRGRLLID